MKTIAIAALALSLTGIGIARADQLADIKQRGTLVCGTLGTFEPLSFSDPKTRAIVGYEVDMCQEIAKELGVKLDIKLLAVEARIPELTQGRVDVISAALSYSDERAKQIDYSNTTFVSRVLLMVPKDSPAKDLWALDGKRVSTLKGSTVHEYLPKILPKATLLSFQDPSSAFLALQQGKVESLTLSELPLIRLINESKHAFRNVEPPIAIERWGLGIRKNEPALRDAVNTALANIEKSGRAQAMFDKWLGEASYYKMVRHFKLTDAIGNAEVLKPRSQ